MYGSVEACAFKLLLLLLLWLLLKYLVKIM